MAALPLLLLLLLPPPPARPDPPDPPGCRLRWLQPWGPRGCRGGGAAACVGHCESSARPAPRRGPGPAPNVTSSARCCSMGGARKVLLTLRCPGGTRRLPTVTATNCECDVCTGGRY